MDIGILKMYLERLRFKEYIIGTIVLYNVLNYTFDRKKIAKIIKIIAKSRDFLKKNFWFAHYRI